MFFFHYDYMHYSHAVTSKRDSGKEGATVAAEVAAEVAVVVAVVAAVVVAVVAAVTQAGVEYSYLVNQVFPLYLLQLVLWLNVHKGHNLMRSSAPASNRLRWFQQTYFRNS